MQARIDALAGQIDAPSAVLAQAQEFGRNRAALLHVQILLPETRELEVVIAEYQDRLRQPDHQLSFGNPEFDSLIRAAVAQHRDEPEVLWQAVLSALPQWRPRSADHIAPVVLLADRVIADAITPARGRELLSQPRGDR